MLGINPYESMFHRHTYPNVMREPPRRSQATSSVEPQLHTETHDDSFVISVTAPNSDYTMNDARATLAADGIVVQGSVVKKSDGGYEYVTRRRTGVYTEPHEDCLAGVIPAGQRLSGGAPTRTGWIALDDDESWILDDGTIALVGRPSPTRPSGFAKKVSLPSDAMLRRATSEPLGNGGLLVTVPRVPRQSVERSRQVPIPVKHAAPQQPASRMAPKKAAHQTPSQSPTTSTSTSKPSSRPSSTPSGTSASSAPKNVSADEYKQVHKRQAAERRAASTSTSEGGDSALDALRALNGDECTGPVLIEVDISERNVQSPTERVEQWVAVADGSFVRGEGMVAEVMKEIASEKSIKRVRGQAAAGAGATDALVETTTSDDDEAGCDEELSYWGF